MSLIVCACADLHIGFRAYGRTTAEGIDQREADVAATFEQLIDRIIEIRPQLVTVAGDVFHSARPSNDAIRTAFAGFTRLTQALPDTVVVKVSGNHDAPKTRDGARILPLFTHIPNVFVVDGVSERISFHALGLSVLGVPDAPETIRPALVPDPSAKYNVLILHGSVEGMPGADREVATFTAGEIAAPAWNFISLGHWHQLHQISGNAAYSGSIDYTSSDIWGEARSGIPKGFIERDLATGVQTFHSLATRPVLDLAPVCAIGLGSAEITALILGAVEQVPGGIEGKIVRLIVTDVDTDAWRSIDHRAIRKLKAAALHFQLDKRNAETVTAGSPHRGRVQSLDDSLAATLRTRELPSDVDRDALVTQGLAYLHAAPSTDDEASTLANPSRSVAA